MLKYGIHSYPILNISHVEYNIVQLEPWAGEALRRCMEIRLPVQFCGTTAYRERGLFPAAFILTATFRTHYIGLSIGVDMY